MARKTKPQAIEGSRELKAKLSIISENLGNSKRGLARELGISYYQASKIVEAKKSKAPLAEWFGEKGDVRAYRRVVELERAVEESRFQEVEQRRQGKKEVAYVLTPPEDAPLAKPFSHKQFKNGYRESYHLDSSKRIEVPSGAYVQIRAKGKGRSKGKGKGKAGEIETLHSTATTNVSDAWRSYNAMRNQTGFTATSVEIVVYKPNS